MDCITWATFNFLEEAWVDMLNEFGLDPEETG
jgi:hypothetical protein